MFNLQGSEIIFILLIALVVLGPEKLPGAIRRMTTLYAELRKMSTGFQNEFKSALDEPIREMKSTADLMKSAADPKRIAEEAEREAELSAAADRKARQASESAAAMEAAGAAHLAAANEPEEPAIDAFDDPVDASTSELDEFDDFDDAEPAGDEPADTEPADAEPNIDDIEEKSA